MAINKMSLFFSLFFTKSAFYTQAGWPLEVKILVHVSIHYQQIIVRVPDSPQKKSKFIWVGVLVG